MSDRINWIPRTELGKAVMEGRIKSLDEIFAMGKKIKEPQIVDILLPDLKSDTLFIGGSPGKGGGIRRTPTRRTVRLHRSGRRYMISAMIIVGNSNGYIGIGMAKSKEHNKAINKATENAKLNIIPIKRGCGSWECRCKEEHSIAMKIEGKSGSIKVLLMPAPKGIGLCLPDEGKKVIRMAGIRDIWSTSSGSTGTRLNYALAIFDAFKKMNRMKSEEMLDKEDDSK